MRLITVILIASFMQLSASTFGQRITLNQPNVPLKVVLKEIRKQSGYDIFYDNKIIPSGQRVSVAVTNVTLEEALNSVFRGLALKYDIDEKSVSITKKEEPSFLDNLIARFNAIDIRGKIVDEHNQILAGATIKIKGTDKGTKTDKKGEFMLANVDENAILEISYLGYQKKEVKAMADLGTIALAVASSDLDEIVVNKGYYSESKRLTTGSVSSVSSADIQKQPVSNPLATLQGRVTGVLVTQKTGAPGGAFDIQIRGRNSISSGNQPLYIVDGVPFTSQSLSISPSVQASMGGSALNNINTADIESIEILKDADAVSIYGSRGANGVVLITTKIAKLANAGFDVNVYQGIGRVGHFSNLLNTKQYLEMRREAFANDGKIPSANRQAVSPQMYAPDLMLWDTTRYTNWQKELIGGAAHYTDAQASFSGGNLNTRFLLGMGMHRETTVFSSNAADSKVSVKFNLNHSSTDQKLKMVFSGSYLSDRNELPRIDLTQSALTLAPNAPALYTADGSLNWENGTFTNPLQNSVRKDKSTTSTLIGNANLSYEILKGLKLKAMLGYTSMQMRQLSTVPFASYDPSTLPATTSSNFANNSLNTWVAEPQAEYSVGFGENKITILAGTTLQQSLLQGEAFTGTGYTSDALLSDIRSAATILPTAAPYSLYRYNGVFGRVNYTHNDKYILNITGRRDGSSRFGPGKQFANFLAVGVGWIFSDEKFIKDLLPFLSFGKLRGSFGSSGSDNIADYGFMDLWSTVAFPYLGVKGTSATRLYNPDYRWEENDKLEGGINLGFLANRINLAVNYYRNRSDNQLVGQILPSMTGFSTVTMNRDATVDNTGWEFELSTDIVKQKSFQWNSSFNMTISRNELVSYPGLANSADNSKYLIGSPLTILRLLPVIVDPATGSYRFINAKGLLVSAPADYNDFTKTLDLAPSFYGGFQNQFSYKGFTVDFLLQFVKQKGNNGITSQSVDPGTAYNQPVEVMARWRNPGDQTNVSRYKTAPDNPDAYRYLYGDLSADASYIRFKNIALSYTLPNSINRWMKAKNARIYVNGQNLFTITKYKGLDPETLASTNLPVLRVFVAGFQLTF